MRLTHLHKTVAHDEGVWSAAWVPGSNKVLTGSVDESVKVWEESTDSLKFEHSYQGHTLGVVSVVADSTGQYAASSALDSIIRVWNLVDHSTLALIDTATTETWSIAFAPAQQHQDGMYLATAGGTRGAVVLWKIAAETTMDSELPLPSQPGDERHKRERFVLSVAYSPDGRRLACGAMDGTVAVYDVGTGKLLGGLEGHYKPVRSLAFTPDSKALLTACDDMHVNMYDAENASLIESFSGHESWVLSVSVHPGGGAFASGSSDAKVKLWDLGARACVQTLSEHTDQVWSVAFSDDGNRLVSASDDKTVATYSFA